MRSELQTDLFPDLRTPAVEDALRELAGRAQEERGAVFTKSEVVSFILDLAGYTSDKPLWKLRVLEPSFGNGDFVLPIVDRLLDSVRRHRESPSSVFDDLLHAVRAVEIHGDSHKIVRAKLLGRLADEGFPDYQIQALMADWLVEDDYLLHSFEPLFALIVGNPPYLRLEAVPEALMTQYRARFSTMYDRADLYVAFIERSLRLLEANGRVAFICSDRWLKNKYGRPLRRLVGAEFSLQYHVDMVGTPAFHGDVTAYTAITVIARSPILETRIAFRPQIDEMSLSALAAQMTRSESARNTMVVTLPAPRTDEPWILDRAQDLAVVRRLESRFPSIEEAGCKVGIGVATGCDRVFIGKLDELPVEDSRKEPLVTAPDIRSDTIQWRGLGVVNPFEENGEPVALDDYPRFGQWAMSNRAAIENRNVARRSPQSWYRTIDRIYPALTRAPKLLIPDIKGKPHVVLDEGHYYPHHNLYYVTSKTWPLRALQAILRSSITRLFIETYSVRMRGDYLRFQAQYLRRIRLPHWSDVSRECRSKLVAFDPLCTTSEEVDDLAFAVYGLTLEEMRQVHTVGGCAK